MRKFIPLFFAVMILLAACSHDERFSPGEIEVGVTASAINAVNLELLDSTEEASVDNIFLTVKEVQVHKDGSGWQTIAEPNEVFDFLMLTDTITVVLADTLVMPGYYTQLRLIVSDSNEVVIDGISHLLTVPSGTETGVKLNLGVSIDGGETVKVYLEFDEEAAVVETANGYLLRPSFRLDIELQP